MPSHSFGIEYRDAALHNAEMPVLSNQNLLENFKSYLTAEKGLARLSVESYSHDLQQFAEFAEKNNRTLLQAERPNDRFTRFADWWPAALIGLLALLGASPDSNAQTLLSLF